MLNSVLNKIENQKRFLFFWFWCGVKKTALRTIKNINKGVDTMTNISYNAVTMSSLQSSNIIYSKENLKRHSLCLSSSPQRRGFAGSIDTLCPFSFGGSQ